jgi:hypothetical protein
METLKKRIQQIKKKRPGYKPMLNFTRRLERNKEDKILLNPGTYRPQEGMERSVGERGFPSEKKISS